MAIVKVGKQSTLDKHEYQGLSTDTKPTLTANNTGSTFFELNTKKAFLWHIDSWIEL